MTLREKRILKPLFGEAVSGKDIPHVYPSMAETVLKQAE